MILKLATTIKEYMSNIDMIQVPTNTSSLIYQNTDKVIPYNEHHSISFTIKKLSDTFIKDRVRVIVVCDGLEIDMIINDNSIDKTNKASNIISHTKKVLEANGCYVLTKLERESKINKIL